MNKAGISDSILKLKLLQEKRGFENSIEFQNVLRNCSNENLSNGDIDYLITLYSKAKNLSNRNTILKILVWYDNCELKEFFMQAFNKERYLDMRLWAIRGYANYAAEPEVEKLMIKFSAILIKRPESTPFNYQEYEQLRSMFGFPYLINRFGYNCFIEAFEQEEKQYNAMPDAFKGHFTLDEKGNHVSLKSGDETKQMLDDFFRKMG